MDRGQARFAVWAWMALSAVALGGQTASADSMRCGRKFVGDGDTLYDVRTRCGDPDQQVHRSEIRTVRQWVQTPCVGNDPRRCGQVIERSVEVLIDEWTYDFGPHQFIQYLTFEQGRLVRVVSGARGSKGE